MATWTITALSGSDDMTEFKGRLTLWKENYAKGETAAAEKEVRSSAKEKRLRDAWEENAKGLDGALTQVRSCDLFISVKDRANQVLLQGMVAVRGPESMDVSEVLGNPGIEERAAGDKSAIGALFAWAATQARTVTLTANTVGLIAYYEKFGFATVGGGPQVDQFKKSMEKGRVWERALAPPVKSNSLDQKILREMVEEFGVKVSDPLKDEDIVTIRKKVDQKIGEAQYAVVRVSMALPTKAKLDHYKRSVDWDGPALSTAGVFKLVEIDRQLAAVERKLKVVEDKLAKHKASKQ